MIDLVRSLRGKRVQVVTVDGRSYIGKVSDELTIPSLLKLHMDDGWFRNLPAEGDPPPVWLSVEHIVCISEGVLA